MRKIPAALVVLGLVTVGLAGCSLPGSSASECSRPAVSDPDVMDLITVTGDTEDEPDVDLYTPLRAPHLAYEDVVTGDGTAVTGENQLMVIDVALFNGTSGEPIVATAYDGDLWAYAEIACSEESLDLRWWPLDALPEGTDFGLQQLADAARRRA